MKETCESCKFWQRKKDAVHGKLSHGECRYDPPSPDFPETHENIWCGKYDITNAPFEEWSRERKPHEIPFGKERW